MIKNILGSYVLILGLFLLSISSVLSQGGSNYSVFGIGDINGATGASYDAIGGYGIAMPINNAINLSNPAMWSFNKDTRIQFGYRFNQQFASDEQNSILQNNGQMDNALFLFTIDSSRGIGLSFGLYSYSNHNYGISSPLSAEIEGDVVSGKSIFTGRGGISTAYVGLATKITDWWSVGAMVNANFGAAEEQVSQVFNQTYAFTSRSLKRDSYSGSHFKIGTSISPIHNLTIGAFFNTSSEMSVDETSILPTIFNNDTTIKGTNSFTLPSTIGLGASYLAGKFLFGADFVMQDFSDFTYKNRNNVTFKNSTAIALGLRRLGSTSWSSDYADKITYSFGIGRRDLYYSINGNNISEMYSTLGMQFPLPEGAIIDASVMIGNRGGANNALVNEWFSRFNINISIGEIWFQPFKREFDM